MRALVPHTVSRTGVLLVVFPLANPATAGGRADRLAAG